jgi:hypothetical protein
VLAEATQSIIFRMVSGGRGEEEGVEVLVAAKPVRCIQDGVEGNGSAVGVVERLGKTARLHRGLRVRQYALSAAH